MPIAPADNEQVLLHGVSEGDEQAFRLLFDHYRPRMYQIAIRLTRDEQLAENILQDTFLKVWLKRKELPDIQNFAGWLVTVYQNFLINFFRKQVRERMKSNEAEMRFNPIQLPDYRVERREIEEILNRAVARLPDRQRMAYELIRERGHTRSEAAEIMKISPETVKSHLENALSSIRAYCLTQLGRYPLAGYLIFLIKIFF